MTRVWPILLATLRFLHATDSPEDCRRPAYLPQLPQRLQGEVLEIWTDPEPETTLTYADEPVIFKPSCDWRMSRTRLLLSKLSREEYYRIFPRRGPSPPRTTARVSTLPYPPANQSTASRPSPAPSSPATPPPEPRRYSTRARPHALPPRRGSAWTRPSACRPPASVSRLPPSVQARIQTIWMRQRPGMTCAEMHRKTKQIMINMPLRFRSALGGKPRSMTSSSKMTTIKRKLTTTTTTTTMRPKQTAPPQLDCKLPHFLARLEPALQEKLRRVWAGFREGEDCSGRVQQQLSILKANDISVESFRMPFPSLYEDDLTPRKRSSRI